MIIRQSIFVLVQVLFITVIYGDGWNIGSFKVSERPSLSASSSLANNPKLIRRLRDSVAIGGTASSPKDDWSFGSHVDAGYQYDDDVMNRRMGNGGGYHNGYQSIVPPPIDESGSSAIAAGLATVHRGNTARYGNDPLQRLAHSAGYVTNLLREIVPHETLMSLRDTITSAFQPAVGMASPNTDVEQTTTASPWTMDKVADKFQEWFVTDNDWDKYMVEVLNNNTHLFPNRTTDDEPEDEPQPSIITASGNEIKPLTNEEVQQLLMQLDQPIDELEDVEPKGEPKPQPIVAAVTTRPTPFGYMEVKMSTTVLPTTTVTPTTTSPTTDGQKRPTLKHFKKKKKDEPLKDDAAFIKSIREVLIDEILNRKPRTTTITPPDYIKSGRALLEKHANADALDYLKTVQEEVWKEKDKKIEKQFLHRKETNGRIRPIEFDYENLPPPTLSPLDESMRRFVDTFESNQTSSTATVDYFPPVYSYSTDDDQLTWENAIDPDAVYDYPIYTYGSSEVRELTGNELYETVVEETSEKKKELYFEFNPDKPPRYTNATVRDDRENDLLERNIKSLNSLNRTLEPQSVIKQIQLTLLHNSGLSDDVKARLRAFLPTSKTDATAFTLNGTTAVRPAPIIKSLMAGDMVEQRLDELDKEIGDVKKKLGKTTKTRVKNEIDKFLEQRMYNPDLVGGGRTFVPGDEFEIERLQRATASKAKGKKGKAKAKGIQVKPIDFKSDPKVLTAYFKPKLLEAKGSISFMRALWQPEFLYANAEPKLLAPTFYANLLNMEAKPALLVAQFKPKLLSPEIFASLLSLEWRGEMLRATFDPKLLSPEINMQLLRINAEMPRLLTTENEPKILSPEIDLQLLLIDPEVELLTAEWRPKLLSPTIKIHLLRLHPTANFLTIKSQPALLSPTITIGLGK